RGADRGGATRRRVASRPARAGERHRFPGVGLYARRHFSHSEKYTRTIVIDHAAFRVNPLSASPAAAVESSSGPAASETVRIVADSHRREDPQLAQPTARCRTSADEHVQCWLHEL